MFNLLSEITIPQENASVNKNSNNYQNYFRDENFREGFGGEMELYRNEYRTEYIENKKMNNGQFCNIPNIVFTYLSWYDNNAMRFLSSEPQDQKSPFHSGTEKEILINYGKNQKTLLYDHSDRLYIR